MSACPNCGLEFATSLIPLAHVDGVKCKTLGTVRRLRAQGLAPVNKHWGERIRKLGAPVVHAAVSFSRYNHGDGGGARLGFWVDPRYAEIAALRIIPRARELMLRMAIEADTRLAAVEAALKLDPSGRAAGVLLRTIDDADHPLDKLVKPDTMVPPGVPPAEEDS